jgi:REG-2-like HAD superfamily hydrolase
MPGTRTICFDATGTLIEATESIGDVYHRVARAHGVDLPAWRLEDGFRRVMRQAPTRVVEGTTVEERRKNEIEWWFERIRQTFQATDSTARFTDFRDFAQILFDHYATGEAWRTRAGIAEALTTLNGEGCFLAVTSNFDHRLPNILEALDLAKFFRFIDIPSINRRSKPERSIFEAIARRSGSPIDSLVYVGDDPPEVLDAISAHGLWVVDVRAVQDPDSLADLLLNGSDSATPATLPSTVPTVES